MMADIVMSLAPRSIGNMLSWHALHLNCIRWVQCGNTTGCKSTSAIVSLYRSNTMSPYSEKDVGADSKSTIASNEYFLVMRLSQLPGGTAFAISRKSTLPSLEFDEGKFLQCHSLAAALIIMGKRKPGRLVK